MGGISAVGRRPVAWRRTQRFLPGIVACGLAAAVPTLVPDYYVSVATRILIFALFAMGLDIVLSHAGLFSLGHAAFFGSAGYAAGLLIVRYHVDSFWVVMPLSVLVAVVMAAIIGAIALRVSGVYFLIMTLALSQLLYSLAVRWGFMSIAPGSIEGVFGIPSPNLGIPGLQWTNATMYFLVLIVFVVCFAVIRLLILSPFGQALQGVRESESRMRAIGYNTWLHKYLAFILSGLFAGVAGVLMAYYNGFADPSMFDITVSSLAMLIVIVGGAGTLVGPIIGAAFIVAIETVASRYVPERWPLVLGLAFVVAVMFARGGIAVFVMRAWNRWNTRGEASGSTSG
jgi:branched-chain amino acid transport system permease protein